MKKITILTLMLFGAIGFSQSKALKSASDSDYSQQSQRTTTVKFEKPITAKSFDEFVSVPTRTVLLSKTTATELNHRGTLAVTMYTDKTVFEAAYTGTFVTENFAGGPGAGNIIPCGPVVSSAGDGCFPAGELEDGFNITASSGGDVIYIGSGAIGNTSTLMGANTFADYTLLNFAPDGAHAVGMDLFVDSVGNADVRIFDTTGALMDTFTVSNPSNTENFIGFISDDAIGHIEIQAEADAGELFGNLEFGTDPLGGGGTACNQEHIVVGDANGGSGSSQDSDYKTAADIVVPAGGDFTIDTIEVPFLTFAPEDAPIIAKVVYYDDVAGLPGTELGNETVVPTILSSAIWINPVAYIFETSLALTPFTFSGDVANDTTYWIEISMGTATNQATVFWAYTEGTGLEGEPMVQFNAADGFWTVPEPTREVIYNFSGECSPLGVADNTLGGFTYYPNPTNGLLSLKSVNNIETVSIFNLLGQKVMNAKIGATTSELNISNLKTGTYLMQVTVDGQTGTFRVLKN
ncbi:MAG: T9SS type A sorting domain-containing protein [Flavobacteriaceae bacterium]|nr:T9SS type A sorting domain-containing protein [Flavobacteriaceae bacterium]